LLGGTWTHDRRDIGSRLDAGRSKTFARDRLQRLAPPPGLRGDLRGAVARRAGASVLTHARLAELVANTREDYIARNHARA
jgi:hypothetical protein